MMMLLVPLRLWPPLPPPPPSNEARWIRAANEVVAADVVIVIGLLLPLDGL